MTWELIKTESTEKKNKACCLAQRCRSTFRSLSYFNKTSHRFFNFYGWFPSYTLRGILFRTNNYHWQIFALCRRCKTFMYSVFYCRCCVNNSYVHFWKTRHTRHFSPVCTAALLRRYVRRCCVHPSDYRSEKMQSCSGVTAYEPWICFFRSCRLDNTRKYNEYKRDFRLRRNVRRHNSCPVFWI